MGWAIGELAIAVLGGALLWPLAAFLRFGGNIWHQLFQGPFKLGSVLSSGGISRMTLSRADYHIYRVGEGSLRAYLATAQNCIDIVSISLNITQAESSLISLFEEKIRSHPGYSVRITLLDPECAIIPHLAKSLDTEPIHLKNEIEDTLRQLNDCRYRLGPIARDRLQVYVHDTLPIGSAILLDARQDFGRIQIETKLYRAPRWESFGFEVVAPSAFYRRNFDAWQKVFGDSRPWPTETSHPVSQISRTANPALPASDSPPRVPKS